MSVQSHSTESSQTVGQWVFVAQTAVAVILLLTTFFAPVYVHAVSALVTRSAIAVPALVAACAIAALRRPSTQGWASVIAVGALVGGLTPVLIPAWS